MAKSVATRKQKKKLSSRAKTPFEKKWSQIEKRQKRNEQKVIEINKCYEVFEQVALPVEHDCLAANEQLFHCLVEFFNRKTLAQYLRDELHDWLESLLTSFEANPFYEQQRLFELQKRMGKAVGEFIELKREKEGREEITQEEIDATREVLKEGFELDIPISDEDIERIIRNPGNIHEIMDSFVELGDAFDDEEELDENSFNWFDDEQNDDDESQSNPERQHLKRLFDSSELNKIYKQLANKLHPDKETDPKLKAYKSEQMGLLSKAKKSKDAFTIIQMFQTHLPEKASQFDPNLSESLCQLLDEKIQQLDDEYKDIEYNIGNAGLIWFRFNGKNEQQTYRNIKDHRQMLQQEIADSKATVKRATNLKVLKQVLLERQAIVDVERQAMFDEAIDGFFESDEFAEYMNEYGDHDEEPW